MKMIIALLMLAGTMQGQTIPDRDVEVHHTCTVATAIGNSKILDIFCLNEKGVSWSGHLFIKTCYVDGRDTCLRPDGRYFIKYEDWPVAKQEQQVCDVNGCQPQAHSIPEFFDFRSNNKLICEKWGACYADCGNEGLSPEASLCYIPAGDEYILTWNDIGKMLFCPAIFKKCVQRSKFIQLEIDKELIEVSQPATPTAQQTKPAYSYILPVTQNVYACEPGWKLQEWIEHPYTCTSQQGMACFTTYQVPAYVDVVGGELYDINGEHTNWHGHPPQCVKGSD